MLVSAYSDITIYHNTSNNFGNFLIYIIIFLLNKNNSLNSAGQNDGFFDIVIGNPPYVFTRNSHFSDDFKEYISKNYFSLLLSSTSKSKFTQPRKINLFALFIIKGLLLCKQNGTLTYIVPNNLLRTTTYELVRKYILDNSIIKELVDLGSNVFENVTASTIICRFSNKKNNNNHCCKIITNIENIKNSKFSLSEIEQNQFLKNISYTFNLYSDNKTNILINKLEKQKYHLGDFCKDIIEGIVAHKYLITKEKLNKSQLLVEGKTIKRYGLTSITKYILWEEKKIHRTRPKYLWDANKKIIIQRISGGSNPLTATIDINKYKTFASVNNLLLKPEYSNYYEIILALINSKVLNWYYVNKFTNGSKLTVNISKTFLEQLPIPSISDEQKQPIVQLVNKVLTIKKIDLKSDTVALEKKINKLIFELYGLTENEITIIEGN